MFLQRNKRCWNDRNVFLLLLLLFCSISNFAFGQQKQEEGKQKNCEDHPKLLRDEKGKPVRFTQKELKKRVIHCETPRLPGTWDVNGYALVQTLITPEGTVQCAKVIHGHPLIREFAEKAVKKWTFKPVNYKGEAVAVSTIITLRVSWNYEEAHKSNCGKE